MVKSRYRGNADQANRLYAARTHAGFESGRAAALNAGISESKLRAHETAEIAIGSVDIQRYAEAFKIHPEWLRSGRGPGPEVDAARAAKLKIRAGEVVRRDLPLPKTAAARLRLARRLAGHASVTEAAERHGWTRSRLSAHETGQNKISVDHAREYAASFNVQPRWLATGEGPSGYPPQIHGALEKLMALHELAESEARQQLPLAKPRDKTPVFRHIRAEKLQIPKVINPRRNLILLAEYDGVEFAAFASGDSSHRKIVPRFEWGFPDGYVQKVLKADPAHSFIIAMTTGDRRYDLAPGDRILIDGGDREPSEEGVLAAIRNGSICLERAEDLAKARSERSFGKYFVLGRWIGRIGLP